MATYDRVIAGSIIDILGRAHWAEPAVVDLHVGFADTAERLAQSGDPDLLALVETYRDGEAMCAAIRAYRLNHDSFRQWLNGWRGRDEFSEHDVELVQLGMPGVPA